MYISDELIISLNRYNYNVQSFIVVILVNIATRILNFVPKLGVSLVEYLGQNLTENWFLILLPELMYLSGE